MAERTVLFKGIRGGLKIYIDPDAPFNQIRTELIEKIRNSKQFFEGSTVNLHFSGKKLDSEEQKEILECAVREIDIGTVEFNEEAGNSPSVDLDGSFDGIEEGMTKFIRGTVRNGQRVFYEGNVVVLGDVNPGGEVIAGGNILVLGILRGLAHAGATGNRQAIVAALSLQPTQLRIADIITRSPEGENSKPAYPEIAYIKGSDLVIEPYLPGKGK